MRSVKKADPIKIEIIKSRVTAQARQLKATWTFEFPKKNIKTGIDKYNRAYVVLENYSDDATREIYAWLDEHCPERWSSLGRTIWFVRQADRTAFLLRWL